jgi:hypothetical protein
MTASLSKELRTKHGVSAMCALRAVHALFCCCATCARISVPGAHVTGAALLPAASTGPAAAGRSDDGCRRGGGA